MRQSAEWGIQEAVQKRGKNGWNKEANLKGVAKKEEGTQLKKRHL